jgi:hypothetical protein
MRRSLQTIFLETFVYALSNELADPNGSVFAHKQVSCQRVLFRRQSGNGPEARDFTTLIRLKRYFSTPNLAPQREFS